MRNPVVTVTFRPDPNTGGATVLESQATWHPDYDPSWIDSRVYNDLAVVKLNDVAPEFARPFRLPATRPPASTKVLIAGFGYTGQECDGPLGTLNADVVNIDDHENSDRIMTPA